MFAQLLMFVAFVDQFDQKYYLHKPFPVVAGAI